MVTKKVADILRQKSGGVVTIGPHLTLQDAISKLVEHNIGSLIVTDDQGAIAGIITERDILRQCSKGAEEKARTPISEVMTRDVIIGVPDDTLDYVMGIMTTNRIRHLPILNNEDLVGMISIGDVVHAHLQEREFENRMLKDYIHGVRRP
jgi:CBS domain-containing protein